ncbi:MAG: exo-alpha-sialidase [Ignavibacteriae bacterium]|nr:exo-alpha-sialidase [Ignavibacteriota bacterium]
MKNIVLLVLLTIIIYGNVFGQWVDGGRAQDEPLNGNGGILVYNGNIYFWNGQNHFQISTDNGSTWTDPKDSIGGANPHVKKIVAAQNRLYANLNFGTGNGTPIYSEDNGISWTADTLGAPGHALGWGGMPAVSDIYTWGHWLYVKWDQPVPYSIKSFGSPYLFDTVMNNGANQPSSVIAKGDTLFAAGTKIYYTTDGGASWVFPANIGFSGYGGKLFVEGSRLYMIAYRAFAKPAYLYYSDDNAENWTEVDITSLTTKKDIAGNLLFPSTYFIKGQKIWFAAGFDHFNSAPNIFKSNDFGKTWASDTVGLPSSYVNGATGFVYTDDGYLWVVPSYNNIFKQKISGSTDIAVTTFEKGKIRVVPNPSNNHFTVSLPDGTIESFELRDILGRVVVLGKDLFGLNFYDINVTGVAAGSYRLFLKNKADEFQSVSVVIE